MEIKKTRQDGGYIGRVQVLFIFMPTVHTMHMRMDSCVIIVAMLTFLILSLDDFQIDSDQG